MIPQQDNPCRSMLYRNPSLHLSALSLPTLFPLVSVLPPVQMVVVGVERTPSLTGGWWNMLHRCGSCGRVGGAGILVANILPGGFAGCGLAVRPPCSLEGRSVHLAAVSTTLSCPAGDNHAAWGTGCGWSIRLLPDAAAFASETGQGADRYCCRPGV